MIDILHLSARRPKNSKSGIPFLIVNCVFRFPEGEDKHHLEVKAKGLASETYWTPVNTSEEKLLEGKWSWAWTFNDPVWKYIPKFDVFWFREYVADCSVTQAALGELFYFQANKKFPSIYRPLDAGVALRHIQTLGMYGD